MSQMEVEPLLTPAEVAALFRVVPVTVAKWARAGRLPCVYTLGGHRRYSKSVVDALIARNTDGHQS